MGYFLESNRFPLDYLYLIRRTFAMSFFSLQHAYEKGDSTHMKFEENDNKMIRVEQAL